MFLETKISVLQSLLALPVPDHVEAMEDELKALMDLLCLFEPYDVSLIMSGGVHRQVQLEARCGPLVDAILQKFPFNSDFCNCFRKWIFRDQQRLCVNDISIGRCASFMHRALKLYAPSDALASVKRLFVAPIIFSLFVALDLRLEEIRAYWTSIYSSSLRRWSLSLSLLPSYIYNYQVAESHNWTAIYNPVRSQFLRVKLAKIHEERETLVQALQAFLYNADCSIRQDLDHGPLEKALLYFSKFSTSNVVSTSKTDLDSFKSLESDVRLSWRDIDTPSIVVRYALPATLVTGSLLLASSKLISNSALIIEAFVDAKITVISFWRNWIQKPLLEIYQTIRYQSSKLSIVSANSIAADMASLERMVIDFAHQNSPETFSPGLIESVARQVRKGDLSVILSKFEEDIMTPIRSAIFGDLLQLLLIQIQKTKVDLQVAMSALDQLLRSNELNFEFMAIIPSAALLYLLVSGLGSLWSHLRGTSKRQYKAKFVQEMQNYAINFDKEEEQEGEKGEGAQAYNVLRLVRIYFVASLAFNGNSSPLCALISRSLLHQNPASEFNDRFKLLIAMRNQLSDK